MSVYTINGTLAANVADAGTFTVSYPTGTSRATFYNGVDHQLVIGSGSNLRHFDSFLVTLNATNITITNRTGSTWPANTRFVLGLQVPGERDVVGKNGLDPVNPSNSMRVIRWAESPITADADGIAASQSVGAAGSFVLNGALRGTIVTGRMILDVPRNVVAAWTNTAVLTVTGIDAYGNRVVESSASGTSMTGTKAFKEILSVTSSASITGATVGTGDVFGLPFYLLDADHVLKELQDGAAPTAGTYVAGSTAKATATTGDVRGTYDPNAAADGSRVFELWVGIADPTYRGPSQFAG